MKVSGVVVRLDLSLTGVGISGMTDLITLQFGRVCESIDACHLMTRYYTQTDTGIH